LKTTPIPVTFDRQGHSCNFYEGFGNKEESILKYTKKYTKNILKIY